MTMRDPESSVTRAALHWAAELVLVFSGAYAAFWLSNYQEHRQEMRRHEQILTALEYEVTEALAGATQVRDRQAQSLHEFRHRITEGQMPPLQPFSFSSDYSATDVAALLQAGGYQLLDVKTLFAIREVESTVRAGLGTMAHLQKLSDELIIPNLEQDTSFFYDPATNQLRRRFALYLAATDGFTRFFDDYIKAETALLDCLRAERQKH